MPSPFPGMDPYLEDERLWPWFQHQLVVILQQNLTARTPDYHTIRVHERRFGTGHQEHCEQYIGIHHRGTDRLRALIDIVSPTDKLADPGRSAYRATRRAAREAGASVTEIDLVLRGEPVLDYSREGLPEWDYAVTVVRAAAPERYEIYTSTLQKRLPCCRVPFTCGWNGDHVLDLQAAMRSTYDACGFESQIDYRQELGFPLSEATRRRVAEVLGDRRA